MTISATDRTTDSSEPITAQEAVDDQSTLSSFQNSNGSESKLSRSEGIEEWGPTMHHPLPATESTETTLSNGIDQRRLQGTPLCPSDFEGRESVSSSFSADDRVDPKAREAETSLFETLDNEVSTDSTPEQPKHPSAVHTEYPDLEVIPEPVPIDAEKAEIELANRFVRAAISEHGHHETTRRALTDWATSITRDGEAAHPEPTVDDPRSVAYSIGVAEFSRGAIEDREKVSLILTWGENKHSNVLRETKEQYNDWIRDKCEDCLEEEQRQQEARDFEADPPESIGNWERFQTDKPDVEIAYRGVRDGTVHIIALYETETGEIDGHGTIQEWWDEADLARNTDINTHLVRGSREPANPWRDLLNHLESRDCDPVSSESKRP